jgi:pyruvate/2-oxoglutarate dehydrogenase complex dihydrolipoamide acyltransferase (E2) component
MELVRVPKVAEAVTEGTVVRWHAAVGDRVAAGQPLVEMITEKAEGDVYAPAAGRLAAICAPERSTVPVGYVLCVLAEPGEALPDVEAVNAEVLRRHQAELLGPQPGEPPVPAPPEARTPGSRVEATPAARRLAREAGVDLVEVARRLGTQARISESDVRKFLAGKG